MVGPSRDGSRDVASAIATENGQVQVIDNPSGRTPDALNLGIANAHSDVVVRVDAHAVLPPMYVANALETIEATGAGNVGAVQVPVGDTPAQRAIAAAMSSWLGTGGAAYRHGTSIARVDTAYLGVFRRDALLEVGGYDQAFVRNQDAELNARLNQAGHQVWLDPRLRVEYRPRTSLRALAWQYWQYGWWRQRSARKHRSLALRQFVVPSAVVGVAGSVVAVGLGVTWAAVVPAVYLVAIGSSVLVVRGLSVTERLTMGAALVTMHASWGTGFLASMLRSLRPLPENGSGDQPASAGSRST